MTKNAMLEMIDNQAIEILSTLPAKTRDVVVPWAERSPDRPALVEASGTWTYGQLASAIKMAEAWLIENGIRPGDRVMIAGENSRAFAALVLASAGIDAWPVVVNPLLSTDEIEKIRNHSGARRIIRVLANAAEAGKHHGVPIHEDRKSVV